MPKHKRYAQALNLNDSWLEKKFDQGGITFRFWRYFHTTEGGQFNTPSSQCLENTLDRCQMHFFFSFFFFASLELQTHDVERLECAKRLSKRLSMRSQWEVCVFTCVRFTDVKHKLLFVYLFRGVALKPWRRATLQFPMASKHTNLVSLSVFIFLPLFLSVALYPPPSSLSHPHIQTLTLTNKNWLYWRWSWIR